MTDTHCHIHESNYPDGGEQARARAAEAGVDRLICVGTDEVTSAEAVRFAAAHSGVWVSVGLHPHDATSGVAAVESISRLLESNDGTIVAVGEIGLDYFYDHSPSNQQIEILHAQLALAMKYRLPVIFHVRNAFDDFWPVIQSYDIQKAVLHSFTDTIDTMYRAVERGWHIGVNGISTFTRDERQRYMFDQIPLANMVLETDAPFLTPVPHRGKVNEPAYIAHVAAYHADRRNISVDELQQQTDMNATSLFSI